MAQTLPGVHKGQAPDIAFPKVIRQQWVVSPPSGNIFANKCSSGAATLFFQSTVHRRYADKNWMAEIESNLR